MEEEEEVINLVSSEDEKPKVKTEKKRKLEEGQLKKKQKKEHEPTNSELKNSSETKLDRLENLHLEGEDEMSQEKEELGSCQDKDLLDKEVALNTGSDAQKLKGKRKKFMRKNYFYLKVGERIALPVILFLSSPSEFTEIQFMVNFNILQQFPLLIFENFVVGTLVMSSRSSSCSFCVFGRWFFA